MPISYTSKINARPIGSEPHIILEPHIVGIVGVATVLANNIKLVEVPLQESPSSVIISGYTETVNPTPGVGFFYVDYINGYVTFDASANGDPVQVTYYGRGSEIDAVDVNELQGPVGVALEYTGALSPGIVIPNTISINVADNFTFPNNVTVDGDLTVLGTTTTIESQIVTFEDPVLMLNYNNPTPITTAGIEVLRDGTSLTITSASNPTQLLVNSTAGISSGYVITQGPVVTTVTNIAGPNALDVISTTGFTIGVAFYHPTVKFVWDESLSAWSLENNSLGSIFQVVGTGANSGNMTIGGKIRPFADSTTAIQLQSTGGTAVVAIDTSNNRVRIGSGVAPTEVLDVTGNIKSSGTIAANTTVTAGTYVIATTSVQSDLVRGRTGALSLQPFADSTTAIALKNAAGGSSIVVVDTTNLRVGINTTPVATLHNAGSTVLGLTTASDPGSITTAQVDNNSGIVVSTSVLIVVTLPSPTIVTAGRVFTISHDTSSTGTLSVNGQNVGVGKGVTYSWSGSSWIPVGSSGGFQVVGSLPGGPVQGDVVFLTTYSQFMGYNGVNWVILG